jgi:hypothetical protein
MNKVSTQLTSDSLIKHAPAMLSFKLQWRHRSHRVKRHTFQYATQLQTYTVGTWLYFNNIEDLFMVLLLVCVVVVVCAVVCCVCLCFLPVSALFVFGSFFEALDDSTTRTQTDRKVTFFCCCCCCCCCCCSVIYRWTMDTDGQKNKCDAGRRTLRTAYTKDGPINHLRDTPKRPHLFLIKIMI